jgi:lauroyl/myristoyl acyltransferase
MARRRGMPTADKVRIGLSMLAAPGLARLPAAVGYRIACWQADLIFRCQAGRRTELTRNLRLVLGDDLSPAAAQQVARDWFRLACCESVDVKRLRRGARPLRQLVEIRGREHLEAALAAGKGAILCSAHFGSYDSGFSVLHASGIPVTTIGRRAHLYAVGLSSAERRLFDLFNARPVRRYRQRPNIEPWPGRFKVAALAAAALRANEVVTIAIDAPPLDNDRARAIEVPFLGRQIPLLPGVVAFERCVAEVSAAIRRSPAHWDFWNSTGILGALGLVQPQRDRSPAAGVVVPPDGRFLHDAPTESVSAQD